MINYFRRKQLHNRVQTLREPRQLSNKRTMFFTFLGLAVIEFVMGLGILILFADSPLIYQAVLTKGEAQVYDGDTLKDVRIQIFHYADKIPKEPVEIWPGIWLTPAGIEIETDIRIAGIDTPEKRPLTKHKDGSPRSELSRNKEKAASAAARQAVIDLLKDNDWHFTVTNPILGKYAGRTVADVTVIDEDVAKYLILKALAKPYDGGTKPKWDWGK